MSKVSGIGRNGGETLRTSIRIASDVYVYAGWVDFFRERYISMVEELIGNKVKRELTGLTDKEILEILPRRSIWKLVGSQRIGRLIAKKG